jgi:CRISPR-associated protein Cas1
MNHRVVDIQEYGNEVKLFRGFLVVTNGQKELGKVPLSDIAVVVFSGGGSTVSTRLLSALADLKICVIFCCENQMPNSMLMPYDTHHLHRTRLEAQIQVSEPIRKRLWQQIVLAKIQNQNAVLNICTKEDPFIKVLQNRVTSGDAENIEAQVARRYWSALFGDSFTRDQSMMGINTLLNYGYAILRGATARAIVSSGLYPAIGIHHSNQGNSFVLADDLMEPFRPLVDKAVYDIWKNSGLELTKDNKSILANLLVDDLKTETGHTIVMTAIYTAAQSLSKSFLNRLPELVLPTNYFPKYIT